MNSVISCCYAAFTALILSLLIKKLVPEISAVLVMLAIVLCFTVGISFIGVVKDDILNISARADLPEGSIELLLKISAVGIITKICTELCRCSGESSLANAIDFLGSSAAAVLSLPLWNGITELLLSFFTA